MEHRIAYPRSHHALVLDKVIEIAITILLMMGAFPVFKELLVYVLMRLYEIFIQHQYLF